ncbi:MAG: amino acid permease, partial [Nanoarchaeota archaeon]|nr:amino acid permease [Nanoarchaeota archaeon]
MTELKKVLNFPVILLITINSIMGTGIYFLPAQGAKWAGPASLISWVIMSLVAVYISMCFAELVSMFPKAGGVYEYSKQAYGRFISFIVGWMTLVSGNITIAMLIVGGIQYLLPYNLPVVKIGLSLFFIALFNFIAFRGMQTSAFMLITFSGITIAMVFALIFPGLFTMNVSNLNPFFVYPAASIFITLYFIQETFFGWESATFLAEETKNPEKVMPKALITGTVAIAVMAISLSFVAMANIKWNIFGQSSAPLADLGGAIFGPFGSTVLTLWIYLAIVGAVACWVVSSPRLILALARDRLFLRQFAKIHPKFHTPYKAIILQFLITSFIVVAGSGAYRTLLLLLIPMVVLVYTAVLFAVVRLRYKQPDLKRHFKVPFGKTGPIAIILLFFTFLGIWLKVEEDSFRILFLAISLVLVGIPLYFLIELYYDPKMIKKVDDILATFVWFGEGILLPKPIRNRVLKMLGDIKGKTILEFGCSVGTLTQHLAKGVGPKGKVFATNISHHEAEITRKRMLVHRHVTVIHDPQHHNRVHPDIPKVDLAVSIGMLGYLQDKQRVLKEINKRLKIGSIICFVDYDKFFDVIPNIEWVRDEDLLKKEFEKAGFSVEVKKRQGFAWKYIY